MVHQVWVMDSVVRDGEQQSFKIELNILIIVSAIKYNVLAIAVKVL